jgi:DNA-binding transcriptional ArsR family regulator
MTSRYERMWLLLKHSLRREIWRRILTSPEDVSSKDLTEDLRASLPDVYYHLSVLLEARAIEVAREEPRGGSFLYFYTATAEFDRQRVLEELRVIDGEVG